MATLAGPAAYAVETAATPHTGSIPSAGPGQPAAAARRGPGGGCAPAARPAQAPAARSRAACAGRAATGGLLNGSESDGGRSPRCCSSDATSYTWVAAAVGSNTAAGYQLASEQPVMAIGGFNGSDPSPTLAQFQAVRRRRRIHYFIAGGGFGGSAGGPAPAAAPAARSPSWVAANFTATTVDGVTLYDLQRRRHGSAA